MASHLTGQVAQHHPSDPLETEEIAAAVAIVRREFSDLIFNAVTLWEPRKAEMMKWLASPATITRPHRVADAVAIGRGSKVYDGLVDLEEDGVIVRWGLTEGVQPLITMENLNTVETMVRKDSKVIEHCGIIGIRWHALA
ncbi:peroxisomal copper amine oxidase [Friedmanniomyces endolithicus]|nr:peroxisomal copper amine oxidase [Friedmanniomyces endolithicus]